MRTVKMDLESSSGGQTPITPPLLVHAVYPFVETFLDTLIGTSWCQVTYQLESAGLSKYMALNKNAFLSME